MTLAILKHDKNNIFFNQGQEKVLIKSRALTLKILMKEIIFS